MKGLSNPGAARLALLGLVALLVFGSCGGGVNGLLQGLGERRRARLHSILVQERAEIRAARQQLHGRARHQAVRRSRELREERLDSLLPSRLQPGSFEQRKFQHRFPKLKRQLRRYYVPASPVPPGARP